MIRRFSPAFGLVLMASDLLIVNAALALATLVRSALPFGLVAPSYQLPVPVYLIGSALWLGTFIVLAVYSPARTDRLIAELWTITGATFAAWIAFAGCLYLSFRLVSRLQTLYFLIIVLVLTWTHRIVLRGFFRLTGGRSYDARRVVIIGTGRHAWRVAQAVQENAWAGLYLVGYIPVPSGSELQEGIGAPELGPLDQIMDVIEGFAIDEVVIAVTREREQDITPVIYQLQTASVNVRIVPDYFDLFFPRSRIEDFGSIPLITLKEPTLHPIQRFIKRGFDLVVGSILLVIALPLMALIVLAIRLDSPGQAVFRQERVKEGMKPFTMYKFRTMRADAEDQLDDVIVRDAEGHIIHKHPDDPRVTRVGRFLRRTSLDELPQLFNVIQGDMSLVGPRPELPLLVETYEPWQRRRFEVPQGMTGWWQVTRAEDSLMHLHVEDDLYYIRNYSLVLDIRILILTIGIVITGRGAF